MNTKNYIIIGDRQVGRTEVIAEYFKRKKIKHSIISLNPVFKNNPNILEIYNENGSLLNKLEYETIFFEKDSLRGFSSLKIYLFYFQKIRVLNYFKSFLNVNESTIIICVGNGVTFASFIAFKLLSLKKLTLIYYNIDYWSYKPGYFGNFFGSHYLFTFISRLLEKFLIKVSNYTWFVTDVRKKIKHLIKIKKSKFYLIPIGFPKNEVTKFNDLNFVKINDVIKIFYIGVINDTQGLDYLVEITHKFIGKIELHIVGQGFFLDIYKNKVKNLKLDKYVYFYGFIESHDECYHIAKNCHFGYSFMSNDIKSHSNNAEPGKIKLYLMFNLPVILSKHINIANEIRSLNLGIISEYSKSNLENIFTNIFKKKIDYEKLKKNIFMNKEFITSDNYFDKFFNSNDS